MDDFRWYLTRTYICNSNMQVIYVHTWACYHCIVKDRRVDFKVMASRARGRYIQPQWTLLQTRMHLDLLSCVFETFRTSSCLSGFGEAISLPKASRIKTMDENE